VTNISQGGGDKKAGLVGTVGRRYSSYGPEHQSTGGCTLAGIMDPKLFKNSSQARPIGMMGVPRTNMM